MPASAPSDPTLHEQAFQAMRQMIVDGELPAGKWIRKRAMANRLRMSATPVVEAMRRLEHEGLLQTEPKWGARVRIFTVAEIAELAGMRSALEGFVGRCCAERLEESQVARLRVMAGHVDDVDAIYADATTATFGTFAQADIEFHMKLAEEAGMTFVHREIERMWMLQITCRTWMAPAIPTTVTHVQIIDAIAQGNPDRAEAVMRQHIDDNTTAYLPILRKKFGEGPVIPVEAPHSKGVNR